MVTGIVIALIWIVADQLSKAWASSVLAGQGSIHVLGQWLRFTYVQNEGAAFGILAGQKWFFVVLSVAAVGFLFVMLSRHHHVHSLYRIAMGLIIGGAVGNLIDRVRFGSVVDFIQVDFIDALHFPVFNVADIGVTVGIFTLAILLLLLPEHVWRQKS
ncbi:signal peptidase II [Murdochiella sp. Marseille-P8839]|nr:signal peptidase II [Murdochiella sp. Marseille-P8839]